MAAIPSLPSTSPEILAYFRQGEKNLIPSKDDALTVTIPEGFKTEPFDWASGPDNLHIVFEKYVDDKHYDYLNRDHCLVGQWWVDGQGVTHDTHPNVDKYAIIRLKDSVQVLNDVPKRSRLGHIWHGVIRALQALINWFCCLPRKSEKSPEINRNEQATKAEPQSKIPAKPQTSSATEKQPYQNTPVNQQPQTQAPQMPQTRSSTASIKAANTEVLKQTTPQVEVTPPTAVQLPAQCLNIITPKEEAITLWNSLRVKNCFMEGVLKEKTTKDAFKKLTPDGRNSFVYLVQSLANSMHREYSKINQSLNEKPAPNPDPTRQ